MAANPNGTTLMNPAVKSNATAWAARKAAMMIQRIMYSLLKGGISGQHSSSRNSATPSGLNPIRPRPRRTFP
ncbi:MAG: hypothetical protein ABSH53_17815 [Holophaga sp.]|jgi:hypothetical protein